jgi:DNA-binding XRE family transcriptional regulator
VIVSKFSHLKLKQARREAGLSRRQLADACAVATTTIAEYEQGRYSPSAAVLASRTSSRTQMASAFETVGHLAPLKRERVPLRPSSSPGRGGEARDVAHDSCPYCGTATTRDDSLLPPFDMTCKSCQSMLALIEQRIGECLQSLRDLEAGETDFLFVPIRPAWRGWRRLA